MVTTAGHEEAGFRVLAEHRRDRRDVGQMGSPMERIVAQQRVARLKRLQFTVLQLAEKIAHAIPHRAEVHRNVGRIGNQATGGIKQRAGKIKALADVHRATALAQLLAHLLGNRHEAVPEQLRLQRIRQPCRRLACVQGNRTIALKQQGTRGIQPSCPALLDNDAADRLTDQGRARNLLAMNKRAALMQRNITPAPVRLMQRHRCGC